MKSLKVMMVAGEASGDALGGKLAKALEQRLGDRVSFVGVGGPRLAEHGVVSPFDISELSILGIFDALKAYGRVKSRVGDTIALAQREQPDAAILIDSWGFTLRVAQGLRRAAPDLPLIKYVGPQVWASRPGRARTLAKTVDHLLAIHVFDAPIFEAAGLKTTFVGNPALGTDFALADGERFRTAMGAGSDQPVVLVLPGSRPREIDRVGPAFGEAIGLLARSHPDLIAVVPIADTVSARVRAEVETWPVKVHLIEGEGAKRDAMKGATVALACSGTVSTELALAGCPMVIAYKVDAPTYFLARRIVRTRWATLFNIAAQDFVAPEYIQEACTGPNLAAAVAKLLDDEGLRVRQIERQFEALDRMGRGGPDPSERAAEAMIELLADKIAAMPPPAPTRKSTRSRNGRP